MRELGRRGAGGFEDQYMLEGVSQMILAADDMADAELDIIGAGSHVISGDTIAAQQRGVLDLSRGFRLVAIHVVMKLDAARGVAGDSETQYEGFAGVGAPLALLGRQLPHAGVEQPWTVAVGLVLC